MDWFAFLNQNNIPYTTTGPNSSRGRVNIKCPWCAEDPSEHLGVSLSGKGYHCWRDATHRGRDQARLVARLLNCGLQEAQRVIGGSVQIPQDEDLLSSLHANLGGEEDDYEPPPKSLIMPSHFKPLVPGKGVLSGPFLEYLRDRGYRGAQLEWLCTTYDLHYCLSGKFSHRVIIPVYNRWGDLVTWTGRHISKREPMRYRALSKDTQLVATKETLLGLDYLWKVPNPKVLVIVEGPFDAFWLTMFGRTFGVYATCLFGLEMSEPQLVELIDLGSRFKRRVLLLDSEAAFQAFRLSQQGVPFDVDYIPEGVKDPATLPPNAAIDLCVRLLERV